MFPRRQPRPVQPLPLGSLSARGSGWEGVFSPLLRAQISEAAWPGGTDRESPPAPGSQPRPFPTYHKNVTLGKSPRVGVCWSQGRTTRGCHSLGADRGQKDFPTTECSSFGLEMHPWVLWGDLRPAWHRAGGIGHSEARATDCHREPTSPAGTPGRTRHRTPASQVLFAIPQPRRGPGSGQPREGTPSSRGHPRPGNACTHDAEPPSLLEEAVWAVF